MGGVGGSVICVMRSHASGRRRLSAARARMLSLCTLVRMVGKLSV